MPSWQIQDHEQRAAEVLRDTIVRALKEAQLSMRSEVILDKAEISVEQYPALVSTVMVTVRVPVAVWFR